MDAKHRRSYDPNGRRPLQQFGEIQDGSIQIHWTPHAPMSQRKVTIELRHFALNYYDANDVACGSTFLQVHTEKLHATPRKLRRFLNWQLSDGRKQGWGLRDIPLTDDETIAQWDTEDNNRIISPPRNPRTHHNEQKPMASHVFAPSATDGSSRTTPASTTNKSGNHATVRTRTGRIAHAGARLPIGRKRRTRRHGRNQKRDTKPNIAKQGHIITRCHDYGDRANLAKRETYRTADEASWHIVSSSDEGKPTTSTGLKWTHVNSPRNYISLTGSAKHT